MAPLARGLFAVALDGYVGVDLFFVLSGFLITGILLDAKGRSHHFGHFYARRALRILPLYYGVVALLVLVGPSLGTWLGAAGGTGIRPVHGWYWAHLTNWWFFASGGRGFPPVTGHFWSLAVEEQFYLLWPLVVLRTSPQRLRHVALVLIVVGVLVGLGLAGAGLPARSIRTATVTTWHGFAVGAIVALAFRDPAGWTAIRRYAPRLGMLAAISWIVLDGIGTYGTEFHRRVLPLKLLLTALAFGALLVAVLDARKDAGAYRLWSAPPMRWLGLRSYAIYVFHPFVFAAVRVRGHGWVTTTVASLVLTFGTAELSWWLWEHPWLALRARFPSGQVLPSSPPATARRLASASPRSGSWWRVP